MFEAEGRDYEEDTAIVNLWLQGSKSSKARPPLDRMEVSKPDAITGLVTVTLWSNFAGDNHRVSGIDKTVEKAQREAALQMEYQYQRSEALKSRGKVRW